MSTDPDITEGLRALEEKNHQAAMDVAEAVLAAQAWAVDDEPMALAQCFDDALRAVASSERAAAAAGLWLVAFSEGGRQHARERDDTARAWRNSLEDALWRSSARPYLRFAALHRVTWRPLWELHAPDADADRALRHAAWVMATAAFPTERRFWMSRVQTLPLPRYGTPEDRLRAWLRQSAPNAEEAESSSAAVEAAFAPFLEEALRPARSPFWDEPQRDDQYLLAAYALAHGVTRVARDVLERLPDGLPADDQQLLALLMARTMLAEGQPAKAWEWYASLHEAPWRGIRVAAAAALFVLDGLGLAPARTEGLWLDDAMQGPWTLEFLEPPLDFPEQAQGSTALSAEVSALVSWCTPGVTEALGREGGWAAYSSSFAAPAILARSAALATVGGSLSAAPAPDDGLARWVSTVDAVRWPALAVLQCLEAGVVGHGEEVVRWALVADCATQLAADAQAEERDAYGEVRGPSIPRGPSRAAERCGLHTLATVEWSEERWAGDEVVRGVATALGEIVPTVATRAAAETVWEALYAGWSAWGATDAEWRTVAPVMGPLLDALYERAPEAPDAWAVNLLGCTRDWRGDRVGAYAAFRDAAGRTPSLGYVHANAARFAPTPAQAVVHWDAALACETRPDWVDQRARAAAKAAPSGAPPTVAGGTQPAAVDGLSSFHRTASARWSQVNPYARRVLAVLTQVESFRGFTELGELAGMSAHWASRHYGTLVRLGMVIEDDDGRWDVNPAIRDLIERDHSHAVATRVIRADPNVRVKPLFNSRGEWAVYQHLTRLFPNQLTFPNCALHTVFQYARMKEVLDAEAFGYFLKAHLDFVVISPATYLPILAFELDSDWHDDPARQVKDAQKDQMCQLGGVPLVRVRLFGSPSEEEVVARIIQAVREARPAIVATHGALATRFEEVDWGVFGLPPIAPNA